MENALPSVLPARERETTGYEPLELSARTFNTLDHTLSASALSARTFDIRVHIRLRAIGECTMRQNIDRSRPSQHLGTRIVFSKDVQASTDFKIGASRY